MGIQEATELAFGILWTIDQERAHDPRPLRAKQVLAGALDQDAKGRGIRAAIALGYQADHPPGATYWAGMPENQQED